MAPYHRPHDVLSTVCPHHTFIAASKSDSLCDSRLGSPPVVVTVSLPR